MPAPSSVAVGLASALVLAAVSTSGSALAQGDPRQAVDGLEPSERGSEWFANESLDLRGRLRPSLGYVVALSHRPRVVAGTKGAPDRAPVKELANLHVGGSVTLVDRLRLSLDLPLQVYVGGEDAVEDGGAVPAPPKEGGVGDLRASVDVRVFGEYRQGITGAVGLQAWAPTGQKSQWSSDGVVRARPRAMIAWERGSFVGALQVGFFVRERAAITGSAAAGVRVARSLVIGPEVFGSTVVADVLARPSTPLEALLGAHWLVDGTARIGVGFGGGLTDGVSAPTWRAVLGIEWAPEVPAVRTTRPAKPSGAGGGAAGTAADEDRDGIADPEDACPRIVGIATRDPRTNGCPPDADDDGVDDLSDACPTVRGLVTADPETNGCPDRDRDKDGVANDVDACPEDGGAPDIDPSRNGCPKAFVRGSRVETLDPIELKVGSAELVTSPENEAVLTAVLSVLLRLPEGRKVRIEGHTDNRGDPASSRRLGAARAAAVAKWLVEHGIDARRIATEGVGADRPVATNETEAGRARNRRIEVHLDP